MISARACIAARRGLCSRWTMESSIPGAISQVRQKIDQSFDKYKQLPSCSCQPKQPRLVAVSKTKPVEALQEAYDAGQREFGENYVQELVQKSHHFADMGVTDIQWRFIGKLQRNKVNNLLGCINLKTIETVESSKLADAINKSWQKLHPDGSRVDVFVQVNTSGEESKGGCGPSECTSVVKRIMDSCPALNFVGLMAIGSFSHDYSVGPNPDFKCLVQCRKDVSEALGLDIDAMELSMGMSNDFEHAIMEGSTNIRVGSNIFGARDYSSHNAPTAATTAHPPQPTAPPVAHQAFEQQHEDIEQNLHNLALS